MTLFDIVEKASDRSLATAITESYLELERNFFIGSWKTSVLDAGHFVEAIRRFIELKLFGKYTPIGKSLSNFNEQTMKKYESATGDEAYRIHIPRVLLSIYGIRNKRGVGHLSHIRPNQIDATLILHSAKWVLAELVRINSSLPTAQTARLLDEVIERKLDAIWEIGGVKRILPDGLKVEDKLLVLLLQQSPQTDEQLLSATEYSNRHVFLRKLKDLHSDRQIEYMKDGTCHLSPKGRISAENALTAAVAKELTH